MIRLEQDNILVQMTHEVFDDWLGEYFPEFQEKNRAYNSTPLVLDFSLCHWLSPLPLLAIATELMTFSAPGRLIVINLGSGMANIQINRARKFLVVHGFLDAFVSRDDLDVRFQFDKYEEAPEKGCWFEGTREHVRSLRTSIETLHAELLYGSATVVHASTWKLPKQNDPELSGVIRLQVASMLREADGALFKFKTEARKYRDVTLQRLNQTLLELIENAAEHAYASDTAGYVGLYARVRQIESDEALNAKRKEIAHSPLLTEILINEKLHQIELFVVDVGSGLFSSLNFWPLEAKEKILQAQYPLLEAVNFLFQYPLSRHNRVDPKVRRFRGRTTGLVHLHKILSHQKDKSRILTGNEWLAGPHPRPPGWNPKTVARSGHHLQKKRIEGTFIHIGLSFSEIPKLDSNWFVSDDSKNIDVRSSVVKKFAKVLVPKQKFSSIIDIRSGEGLKSIADKTYNSAMNKADTIVRVDRVVEKNMIYQITYQWMLGILQSKKEKATLFLCDLGRFQAIDTAWMIENYVREKLRMRRKHELKEASVFLVCEDLCLTELKIYFKERHGGEVSPTIKRPSSQIKNIDSKILYILNELRHRDSEILWGCVDRISKESSTNPVLVQDVLWDVESQLVLPIYLNFPTLIQDNEAARCVRRALRRLLALFPDANDAALDKIVEPSLHDAKKWLIRPKKNAKEIVLVGSLSISGSTLQRFRKIFGAPVVGIVDCIRTPYYVPSNDLKPYHLAALLWANDAPISSNRAAKFKRAGKSAFIEPIDPLVEKADRIHDERLYLEMGTSKLLKVGHWSGGDRHSLFELNAETIIERSAASEAGSILWLSDQISEICKKRPVVIAFPVNKISYRMAHHVKLRVREAVGELLEESLFLLPMHFLPRFAGGVMRFTPLVQADALRLSKFLKEDNPVAIILNFDFVTNRILRHSARQLSEAGFRSVMALGILNRSSTPMFAGENLESSFEEEASRDGGEEHFPIMPVPRAYWRWNVPALGSGSHCYICSAMPMLAKLRRIIDEAHPDLLWRLEKIGNDWAARDVSDFWEEHGIGPLAFDEYAIKLLKDSLAADQISVIPHISTSTSLASLAIERLRVRGDCELTERAARILIRAGYAEHAAELLCAILITAGDSLTPSDLHECVALLGEACVFFGTKAHEGTDQDRRSILLGLITLIFAVQSKKCKLGVVDLVTKNIASIDIAEASDLRIALIALSTDSDESSDVQNQFGTACNIDRNNPILIGNYESIRPTKLPSRITWKKITQAFGRSESHSQQSVFGELIGKLQRTQSRDLPEVLPEIERLSCLLGQCDRDFLLECFEIDLSKLIEDSKKLYEMAITPGQDLGQFAENVKNTYGSNAKKVHSCLKRYGETPDGQVSPLVYSLFFDVITDSASIYGLKMAEADGIMFTMTSRTLVWPDGAAGYFPISGQVETLFEEIFSNVSKRSFSAIPPMSLPEFQGTTEPAKAWIYFDYLRESQLEEIRVVIVNAIDGEKAVKKYVPKVPGLSAMDIIVSSKEFVHDMQRYYEVSIRIPSLANLLEMQ